ncbi:hypothetical protein ACFV7R_06430 [Streptomyces sp. NPDC059866]|uniref:hypothetical protein n=1 Tax=Streptomyces sp. NPDC059866 TaxID=3346978 RepID=UPI003653F999
MHPVSLVGGGDKRIGENAGTADVALTDAGLAAIDEILPHGGFGAPRAPAALRTCRLEPTPRYEHRVRRRSTPRRHRQRCAPAVWSRRPGTNTASGGVQLLDGTGYALPEVLTRCNGS